MHERLPKVDPFYYEEDEITLKELLSKIKEFWKEVLKVKWWIISFSIFLGTSFYLHTAQQEQTYTATSTFMLQEHLRNSQIRDPYNVYGEKVRINSFKISELIKSKRIVHAALMHTAIINNVEDLLVNHFSAIYGYEGLQKEEINLSEKENPLGLNKRLYFAYNKIIKNENENLMEIVYANRTEIYSLSLKTLNETLSIKLIEAIYQEITIFYVNKITEKTTFVYNTLNERIDSIAYQLNIAQENLIASENRNRNLMSNRYQIKQSKLKQEIDILQNIYSGLYKNRENTAFNLNNETPMFQPVDKASSPITPNKSSPLLALIIGSFLGVFCSSGLIILKKVIMDALQ